MSDLWLRILDSHAEAEVADAEFWATVPPNERVAAIEDLRRTWLKMKGQSDEGLRRVVRVLEPERR